MIRFEQKGSFKNILSFFKRASNYDYRPILEKYGREGVEALTYNTPKDTGLTASSWYYKIETTRRHSRIIWGNHNIQNGAKIAVLLQYGHGTRHGGFVQGIDYINPTLRPIFDAIANNAWGEVNRS